MNPTQITVLAIIVGVVLNFIMVRALHQFRQTERYKTSQGRFVKILKREEQIILKIKNYLNRIPGILSLSRIKIEISWKEVVEILLIGIWAFWVGRDYLNFDPHMWPTGREVGIQLATHDFWNQVKDCGYCALWNGSINGGAPSFADPFGSTFHPFVSITTLIFGIINGVKVASLITIWIAGIAQWGIARLFDARRIVRLWSGALAVVGGHIVGKLELGAFGITLSTVMASVVLFFLLLFVKKKNNKSLVLLAASITLLLLSGHGYMQVGILSSLPILYVLVIRKLPAITQKKYLVSIILGFLMASIIIVPIIHFYPQIEKWGDPDGTLSQKIEYIPLNLVIHDWEYYIRDTLSKPPFPYLTNIYIGWVPVILASISFFFKKEKYKPYLIFLAWLIPFFLFLASGYPVQWVSKIIPFVSGIRHTLLIAGLMAPAIIGLASFSLEQVYQLDWPFLNLSKASGKSSGKISLQWILLIPLAFSVYTGYEFNKPFLTVINVDEVYKTIDDIENKNSMWFSPPVGDHWWVLPSIENELKITDVVAPWWWKGREKPRPLLEMTEGDPRDGYISHILANGKPTYINRQYKYAYVDTLNDQYPCGVKANGGFISVFCDTDISGRLIITENRWNGWMAWRDGIRISTSGPQWITVEAPAGKHVYTFRYQPWDVPLGLAISIIGILLCVVIWFSLSRRIDEFLG